MAAAGVATLLNKMGESHVTVAVDGSVYRFHPHFHDLMVEKIGQLVKPGITVLRLNHCSSYEESALIECFFDILKFDLMLSEDGSGRGAAIVAGVAARIAKR